MDMRVSARQAILVLPNGTVMLHVKSARVQKQVLSRIIVVIMLVATQQQLETVLNVPARTALLALLERTSVLHVWKERATELTVAQTHFVARALLVMDMSVFATQHTYLMWLRTSS